MGDKIEKLEAALLRAEEDARNGREVEHVSRAAYDAASKAYRAGCEGSGAIALLQARERSDVALMNAVEARESAETARDAAHAALEAGRAAEARAVKVADLEQRRAFDAATRRAVLDEAAATAKRNLANRAGQAGVVKRLADHATSGEIGTALAGELGVEFKPQQVPAGLLRFAVRFFELEGSTFATTVDRKSAFAGLVSSAFDILDVGITHRYADDDVIARDLVSGAFASRAAEYAREVQARRAREDAARAEREAAEAKARAAAEGERASAQATRYAVAFSEGTRASS